MKRKYILIIIILLVYISCGKSKRELELEKAKLELEKVKIELAEKEKSEKKKQVYDKKIKLHEQKVNVGKQKRQMELREMLNQMNLALEEAKADYIEIDKFRIGRSQSTKNKQLRDAQNRINDVSKYIENIKNEITQLELYKTFEFQNKPEDVVRQLIIAAKTKDFSKLRYLCDPYAENDADTKGICYTELLSNNQEAFIKNFKNGRIIGKAKIKGNEAEVEFAFGQSSNKLEKMNLIKRMGKWYLMSF